MKKVVNLLCLCAFIALTSFKSHNILNAVPSAASFTMSLCKTGHGSEVQSGDLYNNGSKIGYVIALNRSSQHVKAKYFAFKQNGTSVHDRYDSWRSGKSVVLISSGAYATGFNNTDLPVGLTIDYGNEVNRNLDNTMDGLIIVEDVGGVRVTNIKDGDLKIIYSGTKQEKTINVNESLQKAEFMRWCADEKATVFQTHLLIYKNQLKFTRSYGGNESERKLLVLTKDRSGNVVHFIIYSRGQQFSLYDMANSSLQMLSSNGYDVIAAVNLDTGGLDILSTSTELYDCSNNSIQGTKNSDRRSMTNMLAYYYQ